MRAWRAGFLFTTTVPSVGWIRSPTIRSNVDFPQPDGPISDTNSRSPISRSIPCSATVCPNRRETPSSCTTLTAESPDGRRIDRSVQTAARAEPARPDADSASAVSYEVLRRPPHDELLGEQDDEEEGDPERGSYHVGRPQTPRLRRVVLAEVDDLGAEAVRDRRRKLPDQRADDACGGGDLQRREDVRQRRGEAQLPEDPPLARRVALHQLERAPVDGGQAADRVHRHREEREVRGDQRDGAPVLQVVRQLRVRPHDDHGGDDEDRHGLRGDDPG